MYCLKSFIEVIFIIRGTSENNFSRKYILQNVVHIFKGKLNNFWKLMWNWVDINLGP
jgi:hypothetical protein